MHHVLKSLKQHQIKVKPPNITGKGSEIQIWLNCLALLALKRRLDDWNMPTKHPTAEKNRCQTHFDQT